MADIASARSSLQVCDLSQRFGTIQALSHVTLEVREDELLVVLGPTGAGKTTLLRIIAGLQAPDTGRVVMGGDDVTHATPSARDVALVFQNFSLYPRWTVRKNLEFPLRAPGRNLPPDEIRSRVEWAADLLKITGHLDREAVRLSGGEMQRVAIGRAIVRCPRVFLMDEPLSNLDAKLREALRVELVELRRALRTPMVFVTHDQVEALSMADRIAVLSGGRILQLGTPKEIYESPASLEAAVQLGQPAINRIRVRRVDGWWIAQDGTPILKSESVAGGDEMLLGVRPENIEPTGGTHEGRVHIVVDLGATRVLLVHWAGSEFHITTDRTGEFKPGDMIRPRLRHQSAIFWPASAAP